MLDTSKLTIRPSITRNTIQKPVFKERVLNPRIYNNDRLFKKNGLVEEVDKMTLRFKAHKNGL